MILKHIIIYIITKKNFKDMYMILNAITNKKITIIKVQLINIIHFLNKTIHFFAHVNFNK